MHCLSPAAVWMASALLSKPGGTLVIWNLLVIKTGCNHRAYANTHSCAWVNSVQSWCCCSTTCYWGVPASLAACLLSFSLVMDWGTHKNEMETRWLTASGITEIGVLWFQCTERNVELLSKRGRYWLCFSLESLNWFIEIPGSDCNVG